MKAIKLAVFDLAGTTIKHKLEVHTALVEAFESEGIEITLKDANDAMGISKPVAIQQILEEKGIASSEQKINIIHDQFLDNIKTYYEESNDVEEKEGASELFQWLRNRNIKVTVDTGFGRKTTDVVVKRLGWLDKGLIDFSVASDEVEKGRPYPYMIQKAMKHFNVEDPGQVIKIGDTPVDLQEGYNAECQLNIGVLDGAYEKEELLKFPHTHLVGNILDIKEIIVKETENLVSK